MAEQSHVMLVRAPLPVALRCAQMWVSAQLACD